MLPDTSIAAIVLGCIAAIAGQAHNNKIFKLRKKGGRCRGVQMHCKTTVTQPEAPPGLRLEVNRRDTAIVISTA
jgi:hypothetical protein